MQSPRAGAGALSGPWVIGQGQQGWPASTRKKDSMSASVPKSPSPLKSAESHAGQQKPAKQRKNASMSASVPTSPSWLKSEDPQTTVNGTLTLTATLVAGLAAVGALKRAIEAAPSVGGTFAVKRKLYIVPQRIALALAAGEKERGAKVMALPAMVLVQSRLS